MRGLCHTLPPVETASPVVRGVERCLKGPLAGLLSDPRRETKKLGRSPLCFPSLVADADSIRAFTFA